MAETIESLERQIKHKQLKIVTLSRSVDEGYKISVEAEFGDNLKTLRKAFADLNIAATVEVSLSPTGKADKKVAFTIQLKSGSYSHIRSSTMQIYIPNWIHKARGEIDTLTDEITELQDQALELKIAQRTLT